MRSWSHSVLFTRQQIAELTGIPDGVLTFWIRSGLLIAKAGGEGRGSHRKFSAYQVSFAAILGSLQQFGLNISSLKSLAYVLQRGAELCEESGLHPYSLHLAARFKRRVAAVEAGKTVRAFRWNNDSDDPVEMIETALVDDLTAELLGDSSEHDPTRLIFDFSKSINADDYDAVETFSHIRYEMEGLDVADFAWLLWQDGDEGWRISYQTEPGEQFTGFPDSETGIFVAIGRIIRRVWGLNLEARRAERRGRFEAEFEKHHN